MSNVNDLKEQLPGQVVTVELDDIQATVLRSRPEPYFGTHFLLRIDDATAGREFLQRSNHMLPPQRTGGGLATHGLQSLSPTPAWRPWKCRSTRYAVSRSPSDWEWPHVPRNLGTSARTVRSSGNSLLAPERSTSE